MKDGGTKIMKLEEASEKYSLPIEELQYRLDGRIEWICEDGVGHTIYAPPWLGDHGYTHGCDGCCSKIKL